MRLLIVDDHPMIAEGVELAVGVLRDDVDVVAFPTIEALDTLPAGSPKFDLVLLDLNLPGHRGLESLQALRRRLPDTRVVIFSATDDPATIATALNGGARGFIPKTSSHNVLLDALRLVLDGGVYVPPEVLLGESDEDGPGGLDAPADHAEGSPRLATRGPAGGADAPLLTERQREVLALLAEGLPTKLICRRLGISPNTVKSHIAVIFRAFGVTNRAQLVAAIHRTGALRDQ